MDSFSEITTHDDSVSDEIENRNHTKKYGPQGTGSPHYCVVNIEWFDAFHEEFAFLMGGNFSDTYAAECIQCA